MNCRRFLLLLAVLANLNGALCCIPLQGIDDDKPGSISSESVIDKLPRDNIFFTLIVKGSTEQLLKYETPIAFRIRHIMISVIFSTLATFHPTAIDRFGRRSLSNARRRCTKSGEKSNALFNLHRDIALAYSIYFPFSAIIDDSEVMSNLLASFGLDPAKCNDPNKCSDTSTPWGLAYVLSKELRLKFSNDGWNSYGSLSRKFNLIQYEDFRKRPYSPSYSERNFKKWAGLLESDGRGFLYRQEHVVPHIGDTAKSLHFSNQEICMRTAAPPRYKYLFEIKKLLKRTRLLNDDKLRAEIVLFDNKLTSLIPLQTQYLERKGVSLDSMQALAEDLVVISTSYESVISVWKEKVKFDAARPPTIISHILKNRLVTAYAGPGKGIQSLPGREWMPYIATMPHAEYPSASACLCKSFTDAMIRITGIDNVTQEIGGPLIMELKKGENPFERNHPKQDVTLKYGSWSSILNACSQSRLFAGLHFTKAIPEGEKLCTGIAEVVYDDVQKLLKGNTPKFSDALEEKTVRQSRCDKKKP